MSLINCLKLEIHTQCNFILNPMKNCLIIWWKVNCMWNIWLILMLMRNGELLPRWNIEGSWVLLPKFNLLLSILCMNYMIILLIRLGISGLCDLGKFLCWTKFLIFPREVINQFFGTLVVPNFVWPEDLSAVVKELIGNRVLQWPNVSSFPAKDLSLNYALLHKIGMTCTPTTNTTIFCRK